MSLILGIDPGTTTGWCLYDTATRRALRSGQFSESLRSPDFTMAEHEATCIVIEKPVAHGPTRPQVVECAWIAGRLAAHTMAQALTRREIKQALTEATQRDVVVTTDATAWAALKLLHGYGCDRKGGALWGVKAHERAALAVCVAWGLKNEQPTSAAPCASGNHGAKGS